MGYNQDVNKRRSIRLKDYDYSKGGLYFITICTKNKLCLFGEIVNNGRGTMHRALNKYGRIAKEERIKTSIMRPNIHLHQFVVMPNHIHGIININDIDNNKGTMHRAPTLEQFGKPTSNSIPTIIRGYKSSVTKQINILKNVYGVTIWQRNYYEHIIRNEKSYLEISEYIINNPLNWQDDKYYK